MRKFILAAGLTGMLMFGTGCEKSDVPTTQVAVVDMSRLFEDTGQESVVRGEMQAQIAKYQGQMKPMIDAERKRITATAASRGKKLTSEETDKILAQSPAVQQLQGQAAQALNAYHQDLLNKFANTINPVIHKVATDRGLTLLIQLPNPSVVFWDPNTEITDDVLKAINQDTSIFAETPPGGSPSATAPAPGTEGAPGPSMESGPAANPPAGLEPTNPAPATQPSQGPAAPDQMTPAK